MPTVNDVLKDVNKATGIDITKKCRKQSYVTGKYIYFDLCYKFTSATFEIIGVKVNRDHSTVVFGLDQLEYRLAYEKDMAVVYERLLHLYDNKYSRIKRQQWGKKVENKFRRKKKIIRKLNSLSKLELNKVTSFIDELLILKN